MHTLRWSYDKDFSVSDGSDTGWLDQVAYVPDDTDGDGDPDYIDTDDDGELMLDDYEIANGLNPLDAADAGLDPDMDGLTNLEEFLLNPSLNPNDPDTDGDEIDDWEDSDPLTPNNECLGIDLVDVTFDMTVTTDIQCAARGSITVITGTDVQLPGRLILIAPNVTFQPGVSFDQLTVKSAHPCPACELP